MTLMTSANPAHLRQASVPFILVTLGLDAFGVGVVIPVLPELVRQLSGRAINAASIWVGVLVACYAFAQFLAAPIIGGLSDRFGRRPVILSSIIGVCLNYILLAFAPSLWWIVAGRLIAGATAANTSAATAYIADVTPPALRAQRFGLLGATFGFGFILGPAIGGLVGHYALRGPFMLSAVLAACNAMYGVFVLPESLKPELRRPFSWRRANPVGSIGALVHDPFTGRLAGAWSGLWFGISVLQSVFVLYNTLRFGWGPLENGVALALVGVTQAITQTLLVKRIVARFGEARTALAGCACYAAAFFMIGTAPGAWIMPFAIVVQGFGSIAQPCIRSLLSAEVGPTRQGEMSGGLSSIEGLTQIAAPLIAAALFGLFSPAKAALHFPGAPFVLASVSYGAAFGLVRSAVRRNPAVMVKAKPNIAPLPP